jgi:hypothetical protein
VAYVAYASLLHDVVNEGFSVVSMADVHKTMNKCVGLVTSTEHPNLRVGVLVALANCNVPAHSRATAPTTRAHTVPVCVCRVCRVSPGRSAAGAAVRAQVLRAVPVQPLARPVQEGGGHVRSRSCR